MKTILALLTTLMFLVCGPVSAGPYTDSAHGNSTSGVKRDATLVPKLAGYSQGNCAHCHEQHASIAGGEPVPNTNLAIGPDNFCLLANNFNTSATTNTYSKDDNACFYCHTASGSLQDSGITNNDYSATFGGATPSITGIMEAFNQLSYHNLNDVDNFIKGPSVSGGWPAIFTASSNPCAACHNVHIAKRNKSDSGDPTLTAISKPSDHGNLWGDDTTPNERMTIYGTGYQPPIHSTPNLEPDGASTNRAIQAGKTPDYNTFCTDCHNATNTIYSTTLSGNLTTIDWATSNPGADKHGSKAADGSISIDNPYSNTSLGQYILACTDCHEPHGAPNLMLIRREVNGAPLSIISTLTPTDCTPQYAAGNKFVGYLCNRCHQDDFDALGTTVNKWCDVHHNNSDAPLQSPGSCTSCHNNISGGSPGICGKTADPIDCNCCHYHGSTYSTWTTF